MARYSKRKREKSPTQSSIPNAKKGQLKKPPEINNNSQENKMDVEIENNSIVTNVSSINLQDECYFTKLPEEIILKIFQYLSNYVVEKYCSRVCRHWRKLSTVESLWQELNLAGLVIDFGSLVKLLGRGVKTLYLNNAQITGLPSLVPKALKSKCQLRVLDLDYTNLKKEQLQELLKMCVHLESLSLEYCTLNMNVDTYEHIAQNKNLKRLNMTGYDKYVDNGLYLIFSKCQKLEYLNLSDTYLSRKVLDKMSKKFSLPASIKILILSGTSMLNNNDLKLIIKNCPDIEVLNISRCVGLTGAVKKYILSGLKNIKSLNIDHNKFEVTDDIRELCRKPYSVQNDFLS